MIACRDKAIAASVDGMQFYGKTYRETRYPEGLFSDRLGGEYAGESPSVLALQETPVKLGAGAHHQSVLSHYLPDHPRQPQVMILID